jgi:hypothetical protein
MREETGHQQQHEEDAVVVRQKSPDHETVFLGQKKRDQPPAESIPIATCSIFSLIPLSFAYTVTA